MLFRILPFLFITQICFSATTVSKITKDKIGNAGTVRDSDHYDCRSRIHAACVSDVTVADMGDIAQLHQRVDQMEAKLKHESQRTDQAIMAVASASFFDRMNDQDKKELLQLIESVVQKTIEKSQTR